MIERMQAEHVDRVVETHLESFEGFFLSFLGAGFLRALYMGACKDARTISFVYRTGAGDIAGFVMGAMNPAGFFSSLLKRDWWRFAAASASGVLRRPSIIPRLARALLRPSQSPAGSDVAALMSLGVSPGAQGRGAGTALVRAFVEEAGLRGASRVVLTTDRDGNEAVNGFYVKAGFMKAREYATPEGRHMNEYVTEIRRRQG